jgi:hypothetical protein
MEFKAEWTARLMYGIGEWWRKDSDNREHADLM